LFRGALPVEHPKSRAPDTLHLDMMAVFITTLVIGLGALAIQLFAGHDADAGGHEVAHDAAYDGPLLYLASVRFWAFTFLAFGLVGTLLMLFGFAGPIASLIIASIAGIGSGFAAATVVRRLQTQQATSVATSRDVVGRVGRVIVPPSADTRGKVRVRVRGSFVDYVARSDEALDENDSVIVEEYEDDGEVRVIRAPKELGP